MLGGGEGVREDCTPPPKPSQRRKQVKLQVTLIRKHDRPSVGRVRDSASCDCCPTVSYLGVEKRISQKQLISYSRSPFGKLQIQFVFSLRQ